MKRAERIISAIQKTQFLTVFVKKNSRYKQAFTKRKDADTAASIAMKQGYTGIVFKCDVISVHNPKKDKHSGKT